MNPKFQKKMKDGKSAETIVYHPCNVNWPNAIRHSNFVDKSDELLMLEQIIKLKNL